MDATDERILRLLEANGRATYEEISRAVNLSAGAVRGRVQSLIRSGVIRGVHADVDWNRSTRKIEALVDVRLRSTADDGTFERAVVAMPGVVYVERHIGPISYQLRAAVATIEELEAILYALRRELGAEWTNTRIVTRTIRPGEVDAA